MYQLDFMLERIYDHLENNANQRSGLSKLIISNENKKTIFHNFETICSQIDRNRNDVLNFIKYELNVPISTNANNSLVITGIFRNRQIERILINYINQYVKCNSCKSLQTKLEKDNKIYNLICKNCNAILSIKMLK